MFTKSGINHIHFYINIINWRWANLSDCESVAGTGKCVKFTSSLSLHTTVVIHKQKLPNWCICTNSRGARAPVPHSWWRQWVPGSRVRPQMVWYGTCMGQECVPRWYGMVWHGMVPGSRVRSQVKRSPATRLTLCVERVIWSAACWDWYCVGPVNRYL